SWHVQLAGGQTISLPCIVPASTPSFLPPHTFRKAIPDAAGTGLALVDNPDSFRGVAFVPTPSPHRDTPQPQRAGIPSPARQPPPRLASRACPARSFIQRGIVVSVHEEATVYGYRPTAP